MILLLAFQISHHWRPHAILFGMVICNCFHSFQGSNCLSSAYWCSVPLDTFILKDPRQPSVSLLSSVIHLWSRRNTHWSFSPANCTTIDESQGCSLHPIPPYPSQQVLVTSPLCFPKLKSVFRFLWVSPWMSILTNWRWRRRHFLTLLLWGRELEAQRQLSTVVLTWHLFYYLDPLILSVWMRGLWVSDPELWTSPFHF